jgi:hypothetical protein
MKRPFLSGLQLGHRDIPMRAHEIEYFGGFAPAEVKRKLIHLNRDAAE